MVHPPAHRQRAGPRLHVRWTQPGAFLEGNPWLGPLLLTWWPIIVKVICLAGLALGILVILEAGLPRQRRVLRVLRMATTIYTAVVVLHVVYLVASLSRG